MAARLPCDSRSGLQEFRLGQLNVALNGLELANGAVKHVSLKPEVLE